MKIINISLGILLLSSCFFIIYFDNNIIEKISHIVLALILVYIAIKNTVEYKKKFRNNK